MIISDLDFVRSVFNSCYPFGEADPIIQNAKLEIVASITPDCECHIHKWLIVEVSDTVHANAHTQLPLPTVPDTIAVEGPAGIGKTTLLGPFAGGDLTELRQSRFGLLTGHGDEFSLFRRTLRRMQSKGNIIDRSDWVASTVYSAFARHVLFLFNEPMRSFIKLADPHHTVIIDDPKLTASQIHQRIVNRQGFDKHQKMCYTTVTRSFFKYVAEHYGLEQLTPDQFSDKYLNAQIVKLVTTSK